MRPGFFKTLIAAAAAGAGGVAPGPTTITRDWTTMSPGTAGPVNLTNNAARVYFQHNGISLVWTGVITGTSATLIANNDFSSLPNAIQVSINGAAPVAATNSGTTYTLFTGLPQASRLVTITINNGMAQSVYLAKTGTVLSVTGAPPSIETASTWVDPLGSSALTIQTASRVALTGTGWTTTYITASSVDSQSASTSGSNVPSIRLRTASSVLWVYSKNRYIYVTVDDSITATRYDSTLADGVGRIHRITGLSGDHIYNVWAGSVAAGASNYQPFFVGVDSSGLIDLTVKRRMVKYGDSIVAAQGATTRGGGDAFTVASSLGFVGSACGISGNTIAQLRARIDYDIANRTVSAGDVAVLAIGRNNSTGMSAQDRIDYNYILTALRTVYSKVIAQGVMNGGDGATTFLAINTDIQMQVIAQADANVVYANVDGLGAYATMGGDGTHPTDAGYITIAPGLRVAYIATGLVS